MKCSHNSTQLMLYAPHVVMNEECPRNDFLSSESFLHTWANDPLEEVFESAVYPAIADPVGLLVLPSGENNSISQVSLMRAQNADRVYAKINKPSHRVAHYQHNAFFFTGTVYFATCYHRAGQPGSNIFQAPPPQLAEYVAIKKINKLQLHKYLQHDGRENPFKEIARMQALGDNVHILSCLEALEDDTFLYIVSPMACSLGTLADYVKSLTPNTMPVDRARQLFRQILDIILYLDNHGISHRDLSPDNLLFLTPDNLVATDMALSMRNPVDSAGRRQFSEPLGTFGTLPFMPPEVFANRIHDGVAVDLWAAALNLYFMLTATFLYPRPAHDDTDFLFFVLARGLSDTPFNNLSIKVMLDVPTEVSDRLLARVEGHRQLIDPIALQVLQNVLVMTPGVRWNLAQVIESNFVQGYAYMAPDLE